MYAQTLAITLAISGAMAAPAAIQKRDACADACNDTYNTCRVGTPGMSGNQAACFADYSNCLGFVPMDAAGSLTTATACATATATATATPAPAAATTAAMTASQGSGWTVENLIRYCGEGGNGCDYNFAVNKNDGSEVQRCTVVRIDVPNAPTESWHNEPCTSGSSLSISWGYSDQFGADSAFATMTVVDNEEKAQAYFGVANVNSEPVTPRSPFGSGHYGNIGPQAVYTF